MGTKGIGSTVFSEMAEERKFLVPPNPARFEKKTEKRKKTEKLAPLGMLEAEFRATLKPPIHQKTILRQGV